MILAGACGRDPGASQTAVSSAVPSASSRTVNTPGVQNHHDPLGGANLGDLRRLDFTLIDRSRPTVARPPLPGSAVRTLHVSVRQPSGTGPWPLVVFGHGFGAQVATYNDLLDRIAAAGFVVAAPEFPGSSTALAGRPDEVDLDQEPCDLRFIADQLTHGGFTGRETRWPLVPVRLLSLVIPTGRPPPPMGQSLTPTARVPPSARSSPSLADRYLAADPAAPWQRCWRSPGPRTRSILLPGLQRCSISGRAAPGW